MRGDLECDLQDENEFPAVIIPTLPQWQLPSSSISFRVVLMMSRDLVIHSQRVRKVSTFENKSIRLVYFL